MSWCAKHGVFDDDFKSSRKSSKKIKRSFIDKEIGKHGAYFFFSLLYLTESYHQDFIQFMRNRERLFLSKHLTDKSSVLLFLNEGTQASYDANYA